MYLYFLQIYKSWLKLSSLLRHLNSVYSETFRLITCQIRGFYSGGYEEYYIFGCDAL
jgi:hypothetical protein